MAATVTWPPVTPIDGATGPLHGRVHVMIGIPTAADAWDVARWDHGRWDRGGSTVYDITCDVDGIDITYGRDDATSHPAPAVARFAVNNAGGLFTPWANTTARRRRWWIGSPVRIASETGPLFTGYVTEMNELDAAYTDPDDRQTEVVAQGPTGFLAAANGLEQPSQGANEKAGARLNRICDNAAVPAWIGRTFDAGVVALQATTLAAGALEEAWLTADSDGGAFLEDQNGALLFLDKGSLDAQPRYTEPQAVFADDSAIAPSVPAVQCMTALTTALAADHVINRVSIAAAGGTEHLATRPADLWAGSRTFARHDLIYATETHGDTLAASILNRLAAGDLMADPIDFDPLLSDANWNAAHSLRPYDRIRIVRTRTADDGTQHLDMTATVDKLHHTITNLAWTTTVDSSPGVQRFNFSRWDVARWDHADAKWS